MVCVYQFSEISYFTPSLDKVDMRILNFKVLFIILLSFLLVVWTNSNKKTINPKVGLQFLLEDYSDMTLFNKKFLFRVNLKNDLTEACKAYWTFLTIEEIHTYFAIFSWGSALKLLIINSLKNNHIKILPFGDPNIHQFASLETYLGIFTK